MKKLKKLIIACDGESASGKSTAAKLISKKYDLLLINSGLLYRYASKLIIENKPKNEVNFLKKKFKNTSYKKISKLKLHSEQISNHVAILAKNKKIREIINKVQMSIIKKNNKNNNKNYNTDLDKRIKLINLYTDFLKIRTKQKTFKDRASLTFKFK